MRLQNRILLAQLPALAVVAILAVWGGRTVDRLGEQGRRILADNYRSVLAAQRMKESIERLDSAAMFRVAGEVQRADALVTQHRPAFESELAVEEGNLTEPGEADLVATLRADWSAYQKIYTAFTDADPTAERAIYFSQLLPAFEQVKDADERVLALNQDAMVRRSDEAKASADAARRDWLGWSLLGIIGAVALGAVVSNRLSVPLGALAKGATSVGEGQLDVNLPATGVIELDQLAGAFNKMAERLRQYRRANNSEIARAREAAQAAIESLVDPVLVLTVGGEVRASNAAARRLIGPDAKGDGPAAAAIQAIRAAVVADGRPVVPVDFSSVVVADTPEGARALLPHASPVNDAVTGELVGVTVLLQDVTRLRRLDELKGNLVQTAAHELRTPLTSLGMALHLALDERVSGPISDRQAELLGAAREDVARLRALVEDLLDLSRVQEGGMRLAKEAVSPGVLLAEVRDGVKGIADDAGVEIVLDVSSDLAPISADHARLRLAISNLATNAIRHAPRGSAVRLRVRAAQDGVRFEVDDAGPGVPVGERERIFEPFVRGSNEKSEGAGLGLTIAREVVRAHGGRIGVTEADGGGARFWVEVPGR